MTEAERLAEERFKIAEDDDNVLRMTSTKQTQTWKRRAFEIGFQSGQKSRDAEVGDLRKLCTRVINEVKGMLCAHEIAIRADSGNTNWKCMQLQIEKLDKALTQGGAE